MKKRAFVRYSKQGKIVPGSLILTSGSFPSGPSTWNEVPADLCCVGLNPNDNTKSFEYSLSAFKSNLGDQTDQCNLIIRSTITGINFFYDDNNGAQNMISDAGGDMYDDGNALNTNYTQLYNDIKEDNVNATLNIPYTHTQASVYNDDFLYVNPPMDGTINSGNSYFGTGSQYFTNMYPGLFIMAASGLSGVTQFSICGDLGTDGNGTNFYYKQPTSYMGWTGYYKTNNDNNSYNDPSVNHIILVKGPTSGVQQVGDDQGSYDDHAVLNLTDANTDIIVVVFSTLPSTPAVTKEQFREIADMVLSVAAGTDPCNY
jgi:hypothetical protein